MLRAVLAKLDEILSLVRGIAASLQLSREETMAALDDLTAAVTATQTVEQSAVTLIQGLAAQLSAAATDPAKVQALAAQLQSSASALAAAVTANTPAAPPAPPAPPPAPAPST